MKSPLIQGPLHQKVIKYLFLCFGILPIQKTKYIGLLEKLRTLENELSVLQKRNKILEKLPKEKVSYFLKYFKDSHSQFYQDLFFSSELNFFEKGFFVEVGACDGVELSNTLFFERTLKWRGIVVEPAKRWHPYLYKNRSASIETRALGPKTGNTLPFFEAEDPKLSTFACLKNEDFQAEFRVKGNEYLVETVTLDDLLKAFNAPHEIQYLSLDTEGSEFEILENFDFSSWKILSISCEHNFTPNRERIFGLLTSKGYERKFPEFSACDDWYFLK